MTYILGLQARLVVDDADKALAFYTAAFDGEVTERYTVDGRVVHSVVSLGVAAAGVVAAGGAQPGRSASPSRTRATATPRRSAAAPR